MRRIILLVFVMVLVVGVVRSELITAPIGEGRVGEEVIYKGKVIDALSGEGLGGVRVEAIKGPEDFSIVPRFDLSDRNGNFEIRIINTDIALEISSVGYKSRRLERLVYEDIELFPLKSFILEGRVYGEIGELDGYELKYGTGLFAFGGEVYVYQTSMQTGFIYDVTDIKSIKKYSFLGGKTMPILVSVRANEKGVYALTQVSDGEGGLVYAIMKLDVNRLSLGAV